MNEIFNALATLCGWMDNSDANWDEELPPEPDHKPPFVPDFEDFTLQEQADLLIRLEHTFTHF